MLKCAVPLVGLVLVAELDLLRQRGVPVGVLPYELEVPLLVAVLVRLVPDLLEH
ncbi:hypothetical protein KPB2_5573 [Klebsiella pneumoniae Kb677]|nr:hypothetical protein KPB2_5573 [Klebsiella pneumoniae Kb677]